LDRGIEWLAKPLGRDTLLIAVNADRNPVDVTFEGLSRFRQIESRSGASSSVWEKGSLREHFEPFGTRVAVACFRLPAPLTGACANAEDASKRHTKIPPTERMGWQILSTDYIDFTDEQLTARERPSAVPQSMAAKSSDSATS